MTTKLKTALTSLLPSVAAVAAMLLLTGAPAKADIMTITFSGNFGGDPFVDPNNNTSYITSFSGSESINTDTNTGTATATIQSSGYGPLTMSGGLGYLTLDVPGLFIGGTVTGLGPDPDNGFYPFDFQLGLGGPNILGNGFLPTYSQLTGLTGAFFNFDNGNDFYNPVSTSDITVSVTNTPVPVPGALALLGFGLLGIGGMRRKAKAA